MIPYGRQNISEQDIAKVVQILRSDFLTQGPQIPLFENNIASYCNVKHAVAVNSGTSALHIACLALNLGPGDILWTSPITFVASANCGLFCGAEVDFVDIDPRTYNLCPISLQDKLVYAEKIGKLPKVVIPVHHSGQPCDMAAILSLSKKFGFNIIEDASHAIGGKYRGEPIGNCKFSDITIFSFHPVKLITTGEGGVATTNSAALAKKMDLLRSHGITRDPEQMTKTPDGPWYYEQITLGFNYRLTDFQAALGTSQMKRLDEFVLLRRQLAARYDRLLADLPLTTPWQHPDGFSPRHLYVIRLTSKTPGYTQREVFEYLRNNEIGVNLHYIPVHLHPWYRRLGFTPGLFPESEKYYSQAITLPLYPDMTESQQDTVLTLLEKIIKK